MTRREKLEQMLAGSPGDTFLLYALALARSSEEDNKGEESVRTALEMVNLLRRLADKA